MTNRTRIPLAYLITFTTYGTHLHGDERGSVTIYLNEPGAPTLPPNPELLEQKQKLMKQKPYLLDQPRRRIVLEAIVEACSYKGWFLHAAHVRTNNVHTVVSAPILPKPVMNTLKSRSSYWLNQKGFDHPGRRRWARDGSNPYLWTRAALRNAIRYVLEEQGEPMEVHRGACKPDRLP